MLDLGEYPLRLDGLDLGDRDLPGQVRVLAEVLEIAPVAGYPGDVHAWRLQQVLTPVRDLLPGELAERPRGGRVPGRRQGEGRRQRGRRLLVRAVAGSRAGRPVGDFERGDTQPWDAGHLAGVGRLVDHVDLKDLLDESHLLNEQGGPLDRRQSRVHPGSGRRRGVRPQQRGEGDAQPDGGGHGEYGPGAFHHVTSLLGGCGGHDCGERRRRCLCARGLLGTAADRRLSARFGRR